MADEGRARPAAEQDWATELNRQYEAAGCPHGRTAAGILKWRVERAQAAQAPDGRRAEPDGARETRGQ